ncbi:MAG TPA: TraR/DksA C4-type zinc finger protein [Acidimicrobiales bacterium]|nr:TraR/DksA C4-type zinc finger protein [Acidimicrobiales bacterium]
MATPPTDDQRAALRARLLAERATAERRLAELERTFDELVAAADLEPPDDEHDPDGTTAYERAQVTSLAAATRARRDELERALAAIDGGGGYGTCELCGGPIGIERLEALPGATRCVTCAARGGPATR